MEQQLDLRNEAENLNHFGQDFKDDPHVRFPEVIPLMVTPNVLVETFEKGLPITHFTDHSQEDTFTHMLKKCDAEGFRKHLSHIGMGSVLQMIFTNNFVHADLHPGNILVHLDERGEEHCHVSFLDCGLVTHVQHADHLAMLNISLAFLKNDGIKAGELLVDSSKKQKCGDIPSFCSGVQDLVDQSQNEEKFEHFGVYMQKICSLACDHQVKINSKFLAVALALKVNEGLSVELNPDLRVAEAALPVVLEAQARRGAKKVINRSKKILSDVFGALSGEDQADSTVGSLNKQSLDGTSVNTTHPNLSTSTPKTENVRP